MGGGCFKVTVSTIVIILVVALLPLSVYAVGEANASGGKVLLVSTDSEGTKGDNESWYPSMNDCGRYVAFDSRASNLVPGDTNGLPDVFLKDLGCGTAPELLSISPGSGRAGISVTLTGNCFGDERGSSSVSFGDDECSMEEYLSWSDTEIAVKVPSVAAGPVAGTVTTGGGTSNSVDFSVMASPCAPLSVPSLVIFVLVTCMLSVAGLGGARTRRI